MTTFKITEITNHFAILYDLGAWSNCRAKNCNVRGVGFKSCSEQYFFSKKGAFQQLKMPVPAVARAGADHQNQHGK